MVETRTYTKVARAEREEKTRTALLDAAEELFFSVEWEDLTLDAIARRAGVTKQTLLRHFGSKDGLLEQAYKRADAAIVAQRMSAPTDDIEGAVDNLLDHYDAVGPRSLRLGAMSGSAFIEELTLSARNMHRDWVEYAFAAWLRKLRGKERKQVLGALVAICDAQTWAKLTRDMHFTRTEVRATLVLTIRRLLEEPK